MEKHLYGKSLAKENLKISFLAKKEKYIMEKVLINFLGHLLPRTSFNKIETWVRESTCTKKNNG